MALRTWVGMGAVMCALSAISACSGSSSGGSVANGGTSNNPNINGADAGPSGNGSAGSSGNGTSNGNGGASGNTGGTSNTGGQATTTPTPPADGCFQPYRLGSDVTCEPESPLSCNQATWVSGVCTDGRIFELRCSGDTTDGCQCGCGPQGGEDVAICTTDPSCFGSNTCAPQGCEDEGFPLLECCSDGDCIAGMPYCRDGHCASEENAGSPTTSCTEPPVDPCAGVSCGEGQTCVDGDCFCGKNPPCARAETCVNETCYCGDNPACGAGLSCFNGACQ